MAVKHKPQQVDQTIVKADLLGNVAILISDQQAVELANYPDLLTMLRSQASSTELIVAVGPGDNLVNSTIWQNLNQVIILLPTGHPLATGKIQALLEILNIEYTGSKMLAVALANDLIKCKKLWQMLGIATLPWIKWQDELDWQEVLGIIGLPMAVRSCEVQESQVYKITHLEQMKNIYPKFLDLQKIVLEPWIVGDLYTVSILDNRALTPVKLEQRISSNYNLGEMAKALPELLPQDQFDLGFMQKLAEDAFLAIGGQDFGEVKILKDLNGDCWVLAVDLSLDLALGSNLVKTATDLGLDLQRLVAQIVATSFRKKTYNYNNLNKIILDN